MLLHFLIDCNVPHETNHMFHMLSLLPYYLPVISLMTDFIVSTSILLSSMVVSPI